MRIEKVVLLGFGPMRHKTIDLAPGMTVIFGPNESAKTTVHAAVYAALCGMRRSRGKPTSQDRLFADRHRPWDGTDWAVQAVVRLADGRRIELSHELDGGIDCRATDLDLGRDVSGEIIFEGAPDGSRWLGLTRRSFLATACVRQAEIVAILDDPDALQEELQRAAATAGRDETAAAAIARLKAFQSEHVGTDRTNSGKPLRRALVAHRDAVQRLELAQLAHKDHLGLLADIDRRRDDLDAKRHEEKLARAAVARADAVAAREKLHRAAELHRRYPTQPPGVEAEDRRAQDVASALAAWDSFEPMPELAGPTAAELEAELRAVPEPPEGDLAPAPEVLAAEAELHAARRAVEANGDAAPRDPASRPRTRPVPLVAGLGIAAGGLISLALGAVVVGAALLVAGAVTVTAVLATRGPSLDGAERTRRRLLSDVDAATAGVVSALAARGAPVRDGDVDAALAAYRNDCSARHRHDREAHRRSTIDARLDARRRAEAEAARRAAVETAIVRTARSLELPSGSVDEARTALVEWRASHSSRMEVQDRAQREWGELQTLIGDAGLANLEREAAETAERAARLAEGLEAAQVAHIEPAAAVERAEHLAGEVRTRERDLARMVGELEGRSLPSVSEAEEQLAAAQRELDRVRALEHVLQETIRFLGGAQDRVHRSIAPVIADQLRAWLPRVTRERYDDVTVDPQTLELHVRSGHGPWRPGSLLSEGTKEQLFLLLRVALAERVAASDEVVPLLLDEVTAQCDAERRIALLELLHDLSTDRQVVLLSHEDEVLEWARRSLGDERDRLVQLPVVAVDRSVDAVAV